MPRVKLIDPAHLTAEQQAVHDAVLAGPRREIVGPLRAVLRLPAMADLWQRFGAHIRFGLALPKRASELAIIVTARHWASQVEWQIHARAAAAAGVDADAIEAIRQGRRPALVEDDAIAYEFTRRLLVMGDVSDTLHRDACACFGEEGVIELTAVVGYYTMVALMLNAQAIPRQPTEEPVLDPLVGGLAPL